MLRHTFATPALQKGISLPTVQKVLEPVPGQQARRDLAVLVSTPRHLVTLQDQHSGGSDGDRQQHEPGILPALAVPHETRLRVRATPGQQRAATLASRNKVFVAAQAADSVKSAQTGQCGSRLLLMAASLVMVHWIGSFPSSPGPPVAMISRLFSLLLAEYLRGPSTRSGRNPIHATTGRGP